MIDVILLRLIKYRSEFFKLQSIIPKANLHEQTATIVKDFGKYFEAYPSHKQIDLMTFMPRFRDWHKGMSDEQFVQYTNIFRNIQPDCDADQKNNIISSLSDIELATRLANIANEFNEGELEQPLYDVVNNTVDGYRKRRGMKATSWIDTDIGDLLQDEFDDVGVSWRLGSINRSMRKLRPGDFGIVAGRPDKGKTTFVSSEVTFMAPQLPKDRNIVWLNNEGLGSRIKVRLYQSALGLSMNEMKDMHTAGKLVDAYRAAVGRLDRIRVFDIHGKNTGEVESILEENNPGIVVFDMIDKIRGFGDAARTDLMLEQMYDWARERCVKFDFIGLATSQISNEGDGQMFPTMGMLKDSKTGKQGACDFQLMIGASNEPALAELRYIGLPKNKLRRPDGPSDPRAEVIFDGTRARYTDVPVGQ